MDTSTEGVTLLTGFVFDVLTEYRDMRRTCQPIFTLTRDLDPDAEDEWCPIELYNEVCDWVEQNIGVASIRKAGIAIGNRAYGNIVSHGKLQAPTPLGMMEALVWAASTMIEDPKNRGWEIASSARSSVVMKRTQTFNCMLQEGLLLSLVQRSGVVQPNVEHISCVRRGDEFCNYRLTWHSASTAPPT